MNAIIERLEHSNFIRLRLGVGCDPDKNDEDYVREPFTIKNQDQDRFGYTLDVAGQAIQHYFAFEDLKITKKLFGMSKKLPKTLRTVIND